MKKVLCTLIAIAMICALCVVSASAESTVDVYVTIANGDIVLAMERVTVSDNDGDGSLTINDALYAAHEKAFSGGAAAGYASVQSDWGLSLAKLWGIENGGSYGYMVNDTSAYSLVDPVNSGDNIYAFVYTDMTSWSDTYSFFDIKSSDILSGGTVSLTLSASGFDENWAPVILPAPGATITINGEKTSYVTDANGKVEVKLDNSGEYIISAVSDSMILVPPIAKVSVKPSLISPNPSTSDSDIALFAVVAVITLAGALILVQKSRRYEK